MFSYNPLAYTLWYSAMSELTTGLMEMWLSPFTWTHMLAPHIEHPKSEVIQLPGTETA
jgi:hypothetical protein